MLPEKRTSQFFIPDKSFSNGFFDRILFKTKFLQLHGLTLWLRVTPQVYYLKLDEQDGFYVTSTVTLAKRNFLIFLSAIVNKTIQTRITAGKNFVWNATVVYSFTKNYARM